MQIALMKADWLGQPEYRECMAKLYDSLTRSLFSPTLSQEEIQKAAQQINLRGYPIGKEVIDKLLLIYEGAARTEEPLNTFAHKELEQLRPCSTYVFRLYFKHLLPLLEPETIAELVQQYVELRDKAFLEECHALHPSRMPKEG